MEVSYKIIISPLANKTYIQNIEYLQNNWTLKEVNNFINKVENIAKILKVTPYTFKKFPLKVNVHQVEIVSQITLFYKVNYKDVELLLFFNNLQNPNKLYKLL